jgi:long-chain acyl-CoA synthetase
MTTDPRRPVPAAPAGPPVFDRADRTPHEPALVDPDKTLTWKDAATLIGRTANALAAMDFGACRLAVLGTNTADTVIAYAGALLAGVGAILVNHHSTADEIDYLLRDGDARAIWAGAGPEHRALAAQVADRLGIPALSDIPAVAGDAPGWATGRSTGDPTQPPPSSRPATTDLIYTSGTTGRPKGVEVPSQPAPTVGDRMDVVTRHHMTGLGPHLVSGPLYHAGPHAAVGLLLTGSPVVLVGRFDAEAVLTAIETHGIATTVMVPTHLVRLLALPEDRRRRADVSSLRMVSLTGSTCPVPVKKAVIEWFGPVVREAYGASESGIISYIESEEWLAHPGSVGRVHPPFEAVVLDEDGLDCPPGRDGQLYFHDGTGRGIRYYKDQEKTDEAHIRPGVFTLGDVGHVDSDGYMYITGRVTDMVISGGVNIYPAECERILTAHEAVTDVALFGQPDGEMGERLVGLVATADDVSPNDLITYCRRSIAAYKVPKQLVVVPEIPRSAMGKVDKAEAKRLFASRTAVPD